MALVLTRVVDRLKALEREVPWLILLLLCFISKDYSQLGSGLPTWFSSKPSIYLHEQKRPQVLDISRDSSQLGYGLST